MKYLCSLFIAAMLVAECAAAKSPKNEISVSYGIVNETEIGDFFGNVISNVFIGADNNNDQSLGVVNIDYTHFFNSTFGIGLNASYSNDKCDWSKDSKKIGEESDNNFCVMPTFKADWFKRSSVTLYSKVGVGLIINSSKTTYTDNSNTNKSTYYYFAFQGSPIGIEVGHAACGFAELGFGQAGLLQFGFRYKF